MNRTWTVSLGFLFFVIGLISMILKLVGMQFVFMRYIQDVLGNWTIMFYLLMCLGGFIMVFLSIDQTKRVKKE
jgi:hypothetical protein